MGWNEELAPQLLHWIKRNNKAVLAADRPELAHLAEEFEQLINVQLLERRNNPQIKDVTTELLNEVVDGRYLTNQEIASILRNWTVGEVGTIAASIGIIVHFLATNQDIQQQLRVKPELLWQANDEILRIHGPLVDNRRRTTCPVQLGDRQIAAEQRVTINWVAANRDPEVFPEPERFSLERDPSLNLLYGAGIHVCPGAPLARMELVIIIDKLLQHTGQLRLIDTEPASLATYPASGYASLPLSLR